MKSVSKFTLAVALAFGGFGPVAAQSTPTLAKEERAALAALNTALQAKDYAAASRALDAAHAAARSGYARYLVSSVQLKLGIATTNLGLQQTAIDSMIGSDAAPAAALPQLYRSQGALLQATGKLEKAEAAFSRVLEIAPNDHEAMLALAQVKVGRKKPQEAVAFIERAIAARRASGQAVPESWYKWGLNRALMSQMAPQALQLSRQLVAAYPSPANWRDAILIHRDLAAPDPAVALDSWRLMRAAKALSGERDYLGFAEALDTAGLEGEAKAVLDEGVAAKMVDAGQPASKALIASTAKDAASDRKGLAALHAKGMAASDGAAALSAGDAHLAFGEHAKAAELYQAALSKGSVDANLVNAHLGIALAMAGQKPQAETAFRAVTGPRTALASLWLVWLGQRA